MTAKLTPSPTPTPGPDLTGRAWLLTAFAFTAQADCSTVNGTYSPANPSDPRGALSLVPGHATIKACGEDSYGDLYITGIANTASFTLSGEALVLTLVDSGTLEYR